MPYVKMRTEHTLARIPSESSLDVHRPRKQTEVHVPDSNRFAILDCSFAAIRDRSAVHERFGTMADMNPGAPMLAFSMVKASLPR